MMNPVQPALLAASVIALRERTAEARKRFAEDNKVRLNEIDPVPDVPMVDISENTT